MDCPRRAIGTPSTGQPGIAELDDAVTDLAELLERVGRGQSLPADGSVSLLPAPAGRAVAAVLGFTAHHLIAAEVDHGWLTAWLGGMSQPRPAEIGLPLQPPFLTALGQQLNARPGGQDVLMVGTATAAAMAGGLVMEAGNQALLEHLRAGRALRYRENVTVATVPGGLLTLGRGLAGRWEISIEVEPAYRGAGIGQTLAEQGRALVPPGALLWAQVHPANVASMRAFLAAGYRPVGAEVLFTREPAAALR